MTGNHEDAEDILQEALSQGYIHIGQFRGKSLFSTWLYRIAINICCKALRQKKLFYPSKVPLREEANLETDGVVSVEVSGKEPDGLTKSIENEIKQKVRLAVASLPKKLAEVITLRELEGYSYEKISDSLGLARGTVMSRLYRARIKLSHKLRKLGLKPG